MRALVAITLACTVHVGCGRTDLHPLSGRQEGDRDICGDQAQELLCGSERAHFATEVLDYDRTLAGDIPPPGGPFSDPSAALGPPDFSFSAPNSAVATGNGGVLVLGLGDCLLTSGGDLHADLVLYEVGPLLETVSVSLRPVGHTMSVLPVDADGFVPIGEASGLQEIDIDRVLPGFDECELQFDAVRILDDPTMGGWFSEGTGADIDAIEFLEIVHADAY